MQEAHKRPTSKFKDIKSKIDHGKKERKASDLSTDATQMLTKLKGENFSRFAPTALANFIKEGNLHSYRSNSFLARQEIMREGKYLEPLPPAENEGPKIVLLDLRTPDEYQKWHIRNALNFPAAYIQ